MNLMMFFVGGPITMMVDFLIFCICVAIVIILGRWLLSLTGLPIPQPLMVVLGLIVFLIFLLFFLNYAGIWRWGA
jgi:hypothetical protein